MAANKDGIDISEILNNIGNPDADHGNNQSSIIAYNIAAIVIATVTVLMRTCVRAFIVKNVLMDDYLMLAAGAAAISFSSLIIHGKSCTPYSLTNIDIKTGVGFGFGRNLWDLNLSTILDRVKDCVLVLFLCQCLHATALTLVKLSIISTYWRLFPTKRMHYTLLGLAFLITSVSTATLFGTLFECRPVAAAWDFTIEGAQCIEIRTIFYFSTSFSIATDVVLCLLPLPFFWRLKVSRQEKIIVSCLFGLGLFAAAASAMRLTLLSALHDINITMRAMPALGWSVAEVITGIVCACLPCLKPLFTKLLPSRFLTYVSNLHSKPSGNATANSTVSETYVIEGPKLAKYPSQSLAHLSVSGSGLWRGRGQSWYTRPSLATVSSWRDGPEQSMRQKETV